MANGRGLWRLLNLPCEGVSALASQALDRPLARPERWAVRLHTLYCSACRRFRRQIAFLRRAMRHLTAADPGGPPLPPEVRDRILARLRGDA
jgi:predicted anti-sigma-YlaC factor YlaD